MPLTSIAEQVCKKRYYQKDDDGNIKEDWESLANRVVNYVCHKEETPFKRKAFDLIFNTKFLPNSPCLVNSGTKVGGLLACFVTKSPEDSWEGMCRNLAYFGYIARRGGGCGVDFSLIRPAGSPVFGSTHAKACGPIEHMRVVSEAMSSITQAGFRGMANMGCMCIQHPDVLDFIVCKQRSRALKTFLKEDIFNHFEKLDGHTNAHTNILLDKFISNFNISVFATDEFMQKVEKDQDFDLVFEGKVYKTIKARHLFDLVIDNAWANGDPGMLFYDTINDGPYKHSKQIITATNPCFHGDSMVAVADGRNFVSIQQLATEGEDVPVYCADPETGNIHIKLGRNPRKTRTNAPLCKVAFDDGGSIITTPDHKICLRNGVYTEVRDLSPGDSVMTMTKFEYISHRSGYYGIVRGDGQPTKPEHRMINEFHEQSYLSSDLLIHHKDFNGLNKQRYHDNMSAATIGEKNGMYGKKHSGASKYKIGAKTTERCKDEEYKQGLLDSIRNGWTDNTRNGGFQSLLAEANDLCSANSVNHKIVSVEMLDNTEDVFNITVDDYHNLCILSSHEIKQNNGKQRRDVSRYKTIVYKNCGEQCLPEYGSCNLGSIDVSKFYSKETSVDWNALRDAIHISVQFLDDVISINKFPTKEFHQWAQANRPVGLGIMGWADLLLKMGLSYGAQKSLEFANTLAEFFEKEAHIKSVKLAKERGTPKACRHDALDHCRNITTISIAPTGSISLLAGCSSSIEPVYSPITYRYDNTGQYEIPHEYSSKSYFRCALNPENRKQEIGWKEHIDMQATFQAHCDSGISKTINMSKEATVKDVSDAYMRAWKRKCKGITIYRDGSKTTQVLNTNQRINNRCAPPRPKVVEADIFRTRVDGWEWHVIIGKVDNSPHELFAVNGTQKLPEKGKIIKRKKKHYALLDEDDQVLIDNIVQAEHDIHPQIDRETRRFSLELRHGIPVKYICEQIDKTNDIVTSFNKAVARIFKKPQYCGGVVSLVLCPECAKEGESCEMVSEAGCLTCKTCHYSRCG